MVTSPFPNPSDIIADRYEIVEEIGRGGFSIVYKALDRNLQRTIALKVMVPPPAQMNTLFARIKREAAALQEVHSENVIRAIDLIIEPFRAILVMEYLDGGDLAERVQKNGSLSEAEVRRIGTQACSALSATHALGIVHRDIKPHNILLDRGGKSYLTDFGSAQVFGQGTLTVTGAFVGTLGFMAPEMLTQARIDARADIYSLGLTLYFALTGKTPSGSTGGLPKSFVPGFDPREVRADIAPNLATAIARSTSQLPEDRYPTAEAFSQALSNESVTVSYVALPSSAVCLACGEDTNSNIGICESCSASSADTAGALLYLAASGRRSRSHKLILEEITSASPSQSAFRETSDGIRPLIRVPTSVAPRVVEQLRRRGIESFHRPDTSILGAIPREALLLTGLIAGLSLLVTSVVGSGFILSGLVACSVLLYSAYRTGTCPLVEIVTQPGRIESKLTAKLNLLIASLRPSPAKKLIVRLLRTCEKLLGDDIQNVGPSISRAELERFLGVAHDLGQHIRELETMLDRPESASNPKVTEQRLKLEQMLDSTMQKLLRLSGAITEIWWTKVQADSQTQPLQLPEVLAEIEESTDLFQKAYAEIDGVSSR